MSVHVVRLASIFLLVLPNAFGLHNRLGASVIGRTRLLKSHKVLRDISTGLPVHLGDAASAVADIVSQVKELVGAKTRTLPPNLKPFVLLSQQQSGSEFVQGMLDSHPDIITIHKEMFNDVNRFDGSLEDAFIAESGSTMEKLAAMNDTNATKWFGIKVQLSQVINIQNGLQSPNTTFLFHWRRNALRQLISSAVVEQTSSQGQETLLPTIETPPLECNIVHTLSARSEAYAQVSTFGARICPPSHYEDWFAPDTKRLVEQSIFDCFGLEPATLVTPYSSTHETQPVIQTVANPEELRLAMKGSKFEYMLEEANSFEEALKNLKASDAFDTVAPPSRGCWSKALLQR